MRRALRTAGEGKTSRTSKTRIDSRARDKKSDGRAGGYFSLEENGRALETACGEIC